jgi:hypothetical protein
MRSFLLPLFLLGGCYLVIPVKYFNKYNEIVDSPSATSNIKFRGSYVYVESTPNQILSKKFDKNVFNHHVISFFSNHLTAEFMFPTQTNNGEWILTLSDYKRALNNGGIDHTTDITWDFFETKDSLLTLYYVDYKEVGYVITNFGRLRKSNAVVRDSIAITFANSNIKSTSKSYSYILDQTLAKPDSSKSDILCVLSRRGKKGWRRAYSQNSPHYVHPCTGKIGALTKPN